MLKKSLIQEINDEFEELINMQEIIMGISDCNLNEIINYLLSSEYLKNEDKMESLLHTIYICYKIRPSERDNISNLIQEILKQINEFYSDLELSQLIKTFSEHDDNFQFNSFIKLFVERKEDQIQSFLKLGQNSQDNETKAKSTFSVVDIIIKDDIERFQLFLSNNNKSFDEELPIEILGLKPTFLSLSMYFHASKISSFLRMNNAKLRTYDRIFAVAGGDYDLIHYVYDAFHENPKEFEVDIAIQFHQNQVAMWIHENFQVEYSNHSVETAIQFYNSFMIKELKELRIFNPLQFLRSASIFQCYEFFTYFLTFITKSKKAEEIRESLESSFNYASKYGSYRIINFLIEKDLVTYDINSIIYKHLKKYNPIILASKHGSLKVLEVLMKFRNQNIIKFDLNFKTNLKMTPLHFAAKKHNLEIVKLLTSQEEVGINDQCLIGWTPLHFAVDEEDQEIVKFLCSLNGRIDLTIKDRFGETPSDLARKIHCYKIAEILNKSQSE